MNRNIIIVVLALGMIVPGACTKNTESANKEKVNLKDLINSKSDVKRDLVIESTYMKAQMKYNLYLPPKFDQDQEYPILYLLHGAGDDHNAWLDKGDAQKYADKYINGGGTPMIIVMPDAQMTFYLWDYDKYLHEELMPAVEGKYKFSGKRAVAGLSMGGFGTLYNALTYPEQFTYAYAMSPASAMPMLGVPMEYMTEKAAALASVTPHPDFTIEVGEQDTTVSNADALTVSNAINEAAHCEWISRPGIHYWDFWQECLPKALAKVGDSFK